MEKHFTPKKACEILGISIGTLQRMDRDGLLRCIRTPRGRRRIPESELRRLSGTSSSPKVMVLYGRVSSHDQKKKGDLDRQIDQLKQAYTSDIYSEIMVIKDVGSGLSEKRRGLKKLFQLARERKISDVAVTYQDRLTRFGFSYLETFFSHCDVKVHVLKARGKSSLEEELTKDLISIITSFSGKLYGLRSRKTKEVIKKVKDALVNDEKR